MAANERESVKTCPSAFIRDPIFLSALTYANLRQKAFFGIRC
jgi:hypothetical protein